MKKQEKNQKKFNLNIKGYYVLLSKNETSTSDYNLNAQVFKDGNSKAIAGTSFKFDENNDNIIRWAEQKAKNDVEDNGLNEILNHII